jgi:hypothetical protein
VNQYDEHTRVDEARALGSWVGAATICPACNRAASVLFEGQLWSPGHGVFVCVCTPMMVVTAESIAEAHGWAELVPGDGRGQRTD